MAWRSRSCGVVPVALVAITLAAAPASAGAESDEHALLVQLRACARIDALADRAACYDRHLRPPVATRSASVPPAVVAPPAAGFGSEALRPRTPAPEQEAYTGRVATVRERQPGIYVVTLADGAEWQFASSASYAYEAPRPGTIVEIRRAALGSFLLRFDRQAAVRVLRVR